MVASGNGALGLTLALGAYDLLLVGFLSALNQVKHVPGCG